MGEFVTGFLTPLIKVVFIGGFFGTGIFFLVKAFYNGWSKSFKFIWKYKIRKKAYPQEIVEWCSMCVDDGIGWYDAKKILMVKMIPKKQINETLWIYDQIIIELKGGIDKNGRKFKGVSGQVERKTKRELPNIREK